MLSTLSIPLKSAQILARTQGYSDIAKATSSLVQLVPEVKLSVYRSYLGRTGTQSIVRATFILSR